MTTKTKIGLYKQGDKLSDVKYWMSRPPVERLLALEQIRQQYIQWKYGTEQRLQSVYRLVKTKRESLVCQNAVLIIDYR